MLQIMILMYADDTVILANSPKQLQLALDNLKQYCDKWKLIVNINKTKIMIFSKIKIKNKPTLKYNNEVIENVDHFKYLGITLKFNGYFDVCKKSLYDQAMRAMFSLLSKGRRLKLPTDLMLDLFDKTIVPILLYGCET